MKKSRSEKKEEWKEESRSHKKEEEEKVKPKNMRVRVNVGGRIFETYTETLCKYPQTLLGVRRCCCFSFQPKQTFSPKNYKTYAIVSEDPDHQFFFDRFAVDNC
jgi:hypothetical protein